MTEAVKTYNDYTVRFLAIIKGSKSFVDIPRSSYEINLPPRVWLIAEFVPDKKSVEWLVLQDAYEQGFTGDSPTARRLRNLVPLAHETTTLYRRIHVYRGGVLPEVTRHTYEPLSAGPSLFTLADLFPYAIRRTR